MEVAFLTAGTALPPCLPLPRAMLGLPVSSTAKVMYARLLDAALAGALGRSAMTVKRALRELEDAGLLLRVRQGFGEPNKIYVLIPRDAQKQDCGKAAEPV